MDVAIYDPKKITVTIANKIITGFASDGVVTVTKNEDSVTPSVGVQGDVAYSENANESGNVAITLMGTSSSLSYIRGLVEKRKLVNLNIADANEADKIHINEDNCRILKMPDISRNKEQATATINIFVPELNVR